MGNRTTRKNLISKLLLDGDLDAIVDLARGTRGVTSTLTGLTYDKSELTSWRAMDAIGQISATESSARVRITLERLLWMMREESGTNPWSAAEIVGEIVARTPEPFEDIAPIVVTFSEEPIMRAGAMRAMYRIGASRPDLVQEFAPLAVLYSSDADPQVRGYSALALGQVESPDKSATLKRLSSDNAPFLFYDLEDLRNITVADVAQIALG